MRVNLGTTWQLWRAQHAAPCQLNSKWRLCLQEQGRCKTDLPQKILSQKILSLILQASICRVSSAWFLNLFLVHKPHGQGTFLLWSQG